MKKTIKFFFMIVYLSVFLSACANLTKLKGSDEPAVLYKNYPEERLFQDGENSLADKKYTNTIKYFEALDSLYPFGPHSQQAQLQIIWAYYKTEDYLSAEAAADRYIHLYPRDEHVDYAYYMKGLSELKANKNFFQRVFPIDDSSRDLESAKEAFFTFNDLIQLMPDSPYVPDARQRMIYLRSLFAKHELDIGEYYFKRKAYVAAANRASYIIQHYQGTPQTEAALILSVKANQALGANQAAEDALHVLTINYPSSPELKKLMR
jgi:outer membrane protein assembly factor BamD